MSRITCGIKTLERPASVRKLLASIKRQWPELRCVVVDDSRQPALPKSLQDECKYIKLPFDTGLGAGRNVMIDAVETEYTLYLDDDFVFIGDTRPDVFQAILDSDEVDLVGGQYKERNGFRLYHGLLEQKGSTLYYHRKTRGQFTVDYRGQAVPVHRVDIVNNFFLGRTEQLQEIRWDAELKINTHTEFFIRASQAVRIGYCPPVHVYHAHDRPSEEYKRLRHRKFRPIGLAKHGITHAKYTGRWR